MDHGFWYGFWFIVHNFINCLNSERFGMASAAILVWVFVSLCVPLSIFIVSYLMQSAMENKLKP